MTIVCAISFSCDESPDVDNTVTTNIPQPRIISLAPALTQILVDLKQSSLLVGIAEYDYSAPKKLPIVGNYLNINYEVILECKPSHILMLTGKEGIPQKLQDLSRSHNFVIISWPNPNNIKDIRKIIFNHENIDAPSFMSLFDFGLDAIQLKNKFHDNLLNIKELLPYRPQPNVLICISLSPIMATTAGDTGTVLDDLLTNFLNSKNAASDYKVPAPTLSKEDILEIKPDIILVLSPQPIDNKEVTEKNDSKPMQLYQPIDLASNSQFKVFQGLDIPAVTNNRIYQITHPLVMLPSTSLDDIAKELAAVIYPKLAEQIKAIKLEIDIESEDSEEDQSPQVE